MMSARDLMGTACLICNLRRILQSSVLDPHPSTLNSQPEHWTFRMKLARDLMGTACRICNLINHRMSPSKPALSFPLSLSLSLYLPHIYIYIYAPGSRMKLAKDLMGTACRICNLPLIVHATSEPCRRREFLINLLVRIHSIIVMIRWTDLAP